MGIKIIKREGGSFKEKLYLPAIFSGMKTTMRHFITNVRDTSNVKTFSYPEEQPIDITARYRGVYRLI